ncbi:MAG: CPBP family intramembrane glutamic endopeptidase [Verrucomicrobiota bacterium]
MNENPVMIVVYVGVAAYVLQMYWADYKAVKAGKPSSGMMPGATPFGLWAVLIGLLGTLMILAAEVFGEIALGISDDQSTTAWFLVITWICAGVVEEIIFRGYLVVENKGKAALMGSCVGFSLIFALIHPHLWSMEDGFHLTLTQKGFFTTTLLFANSLWWYAVRFGPWNPNRSIFPCMIAHAASNLGVFFVKLAQGYVIF